MKGDFSRKTFDAARHYSGVLMQQGRVQLDADWNEQLAIQRHRDYTEAEDVIGLCGAPKHDAGLLVQPAPDGADLIVFPGRYYVHGRLCELEATGVSATFVSATDVTVAVWHVDGADFAAGQYVQLTAANVASAVFRIQTADQAGLRLTFTSSIAAFQPALGLEVRRLLTYLTQPDLPDPAYASASAPPALDVPDGSYLVYLDVWPRHVTALDDDLIREKALGGPDTATRVKTLWQVRLWPGPDDGDPLPDDTDCATDVGGFDALTAAPTGRLSARARPGEDPGPCVLPAGAGYLGLENQLYRVEIHQGGTLGLDTVTFKWSRDNGSVVKAILPIANSTDHTVETGPDEVFELANGQWVEQLDDAVDLNAIARDLFQFQRDPVTGAVTLDFPVDEARHPKLRRWDSPGTVEIPFPPVGDGWIALENGVQVRFAAGTYRNGDYWLIPARTVVGDVEWPQDAAGKPLAQPRRGIHHHYCRIGVLHVSGETLEVEDCRPIFPPLTELKATYSCCTFTVGDGATFVGDFTLIQEAVNHLPAEGGQICIFPGTYVENVQINALKNVHIKGCGARTRIVANPPGDNGVAQPVFHVISSENVKIESLAVEAALTAPGILADGDKPNVRLAIEKVLLKATKASAMRVRGSEDVTIQGCHVEMADFNGGSPGIHLQAEGALVRENVVEGPRTALSTGQGALVVSGLQLAGGCERVRVHDNLIQVLSGQGITLGSVVLVGPNGDPVPPGDGSGGGGDPCDNCDDPSTGETPPGGGDEPPNHLESEGMLRDIDIRRNRIFDVGLDGIGVALFFAPRRGGRQSASVLMQDVAIVDNRIERCVRRRFAPIPPAMVDLMAYGGITLSFVEGLVVRDNRIEDMGLGGVLPTCGLFVLYVEGLEVARNLILNTGRALAPEEAGLVGRRGGIHIVHALPLASVVGGGAAPTGLASAANLGFPRRAAPAAAVEENTVDVVRGQALTLGALGPVSVLSNRFATRGLVAEDLAQLQEQSPSTALLHFSSVVAILDLAAAKLGAVNAAAATFGISTNPPPLPTPNNLSGEVLFNDNQCLLDLVHGPGGNEPGPLPFGFLLPALLVLTSDDLGFADNQCDCFLNEKSMLVANVLVGLWTVRVVGNRFSETLTKTLGSVFDLGLMNMTVNNQADHCIYTFNLFRLQVQPNQILITGYLPNYCGNARRNLVAAMRAVS